MRIAITGGDGFVGGHVARQLEGEGHEVVLLSRRTGIDLAVADPAAIRHRLAGCDAVVLCAGINRERGRQTYRRLHVDGTRHVVEAARATGVRRVVLVSFLRARPDGPSAYHRSKWVAEEIVRGSGLPFTVVKPGVIFGRGDHLIDHLSRALRTIPIFGLVGRVDRGIRPVAVEDVVRVLGAAALGDPRLRDRTVAVVGPETLDLREIVRRVGSVVGRRPTCVRLPVAAHLALAWVAEQTMRVPLIARAQVRILAEGATDAAPFGDPPPIDLQPAVRFEATAIRAGLPPDGRGFTHRDLRWCGT